MVDTTLTANNAHADFNKAKINSNIFQCGSGNTIIVDECGPSTIEAERDYIEGDQYNTTHNYGETGLTDEQKEKYCKELKEYLQEFAIDKIEIDGELSDFPRCVKKNHPKYVCDDETQFFSRDKISTNNINILKESQPISHECLFKKAQEHANQVVPKYYADETHGRKKFLLNYGNVVVLLGEAKTGKTKFAQSFFNYCKNEYKYCFYVDLTRHEDERRMITISNFLLRKDDFEWMKNPTWSIDILKHLVKENDDNMCIIIDGMDSLSLKVIKQKFSHSGNYYEEQRADAILKNILIGELFQKSKKFITARSYNFYKLPLEKNLKNFFVVWAVGENPENILRHNFDNSGNDDPNVINNNHVANSQVLNYLVDHTDFKTFCSSPLQCIHLQRCYQALLNKFNADQLDCITCVMVSLVAHYVGELSLSGSVSTDLCSFALSLLVEDHLNFIFKDDDLEENLLYQDGISAFLTSYLHKDELIGNRENCSVKHYFSHILLQEFLQACGLASKQPEEFEATLQNEIEQILTNVVETSSEPELTILQTTVFFKFLCGLLANKNNDSSKWNFVDLKKLKQKREFLRKRLKNNNNLAHLIDICKKEMHD